MNIKINFKKTLILIGFLLIVILVGYLLFKLFISPTGQINLIPNQDPEQTGQTSGGLPNAGEGSGQIIDDLEPGRLVPDDSTNIDGQNIDQLLQETASRDNKITNITTHSTLDPTLAVNGAGVNYYNKEDNKFYQLNSDGEVVALSDEQFYQVQDVNWSPKQDKAVMTFPDDSKIIYDFNTEQQVSLPSHWQEFDWSPSGEQLAFKSIGYSTDNRYMAIVNSDGSGSQVIEKIGNNADKIITSWSPNNQIIALMTEGTSFDSKTVYFMGLNGENFRSMEIAGRGFNHIWSPQGDKLIYSVYSSATDYKPMLWIADAQGDDIGANQVPLGLETWGDKCIFANNNELYCAVPRALDQGAGMLPNIANNSSDDLYYINLQTNTKTIISEEGYYNMINLIITENQNSLYFTDKLSGRLHKIEL